MTSPAQSPEQIIAEALHAEWSMVAKDLRARWEGPFPFEWSSGVPENWLARHSLAALKSNGFHVFSERELWAYVRERVLADEARDVATDAYWHSFRERSPAMRSALAAAIDHGEQRGR